MKRFYTCVILCTAAVLYSQTTFAGRVMGLITSENDNVPLRKASVQISGLGSTVTNRNGIYLFRAVPAGHYWLIVKAAGHKTDSILFSVNFKDVQVVNVTLHRISTAHDTVSAGGKRYFFLSVLCVFFAPFALLKSKPIAPQRTQRERKDREG